MRRALPLVLGCVLLAASPSRADDLSSAIDQAKTAYLRGDLSRAAATLQQVVSQIHQRLSDSFFKLLPAPLPGWQGEEPESQGLGVVGGGLTITRAYTKGDGALNASLIMDNPAVAGVAAMFANPSLQAGQAGMRKVKVGADDALLRWDAHEKSGEIMMVLGDRVLLQIEGNDIDNGEILTEAMKGWNVAGIRKQLGM